MANSDYMLLALEEAKLALEEGEVPVGAVIVKDGEVLSRAHNTRENSHDISGHAEIEAMRLAGKALGHWSLEGCSIYVTLEPCFMCGGALAQSRISAIHYAADDPKEGAISSKYGIFDEPGKPHPLIYRGQRKEEAEALLKQFFLSHRA